MAHLLLQSAVFPSPHPYSWPVIGSMEDLDAASLDDVRAFFRKHYAPSNASLAIAGDFDPDHARRLVERYFGDIPPGSPISRVGRMESDLRGQVSLSMRDRVQLARLYLVWPTGPIFGPDEAAVTILSGVLGDGRSSRLYDSLVYRKQIARDVGVYNHAQEIAGEFHLQVTLNEGHSPEQAEEALREHVERIIQEPPTEEELQRAKNRIRSAHVRQLERLGGFGGRADQLNYYNTLAGDPGTINTDLDRYDAVTPEQVRRAAEATLNGAHVRLVVTPEKPLRASSDESLDRTAMPAAAAPARFTPPKPRSLRLSNGIGVRFVRKPGVPMVAVRAVVRAGAIMDPPNSPGLSNFAASMLPEGTANRTSQQIAAQMEFLGAHLGVDVAREHSVVSTAALTSHWEQALDVLADSLRNAAFPDFDLKRMRERHLTDLRRVADNPASIAARASRGLVYGPNSAYGHPVSGTEDVIRDASRDDLMAHYAALYSPTNTTLIVVGDLDEADALDKLEAAFGDWRGDAAPTAPPDDADSPAPSEIVIHVADKSGAPQSVIRAGHLVIPRRHPDYLALNVLNYLFGGQFSARLNTNLRQDKGYSYGYTSSISWFAGPSMLMAGGGVQTAVTADAVSETIKEFREIRSTRPATAEELADALDGIRRGLPSQFETVSQTAAQLTRMVVHDLPNDYFDTYLDALDALTLDDIRRVADEHLDDTRLVILVVGDRATVEPALRELGYDVRGVDYEGRVWG